VVGLVLEILKDVAFSCVIYLHNNLTYILVISNCRIYKCQRSYIGRYTIIRLVNYMVGITCHFKDIFKHYRLVRPQYLLQDSQWVYFIEHAYFVEQVYFSTHG